MKTERNTFDCDKINALSLPCIDDNDDGVSSLQSCGIESFMMFFFVNLQLVVSNVCYVFWRYVSLIQLLFPWKKIISDR